MPATLASASRSPAFGPFELEDGQSYSVGRGHSTDIVLDDPSVSREHCVIQRDDEGWMVTDNGSHNGTYVNGRNVSVARLAQGDVLRIGRVEFRFGIGGQATGAQRAADGATGTAARAETAAVPRTRAEAVQSSRDAQKIGPYALVEEVGRGSTSTVHKAVDSRTNVDVALKVLHQDLTRSREMMTRLLYPKVRPNADSVLV